MIAQFKIEGELKLDASGAGIAVFLDHDALDAASAEGVLRLDLGEDTWADMGRPRSVVVQVMTL